jgi:hypothetical protein
MDERGFISVAEAGRRAFGLAPAQAHVYASRGLIPVIRVGRRCLVPVAALNRLVEEIARTAGDKALDNWREHVGGGA